MWYGYNKGRLESSPAVQQIPRPSVSPAMSKTSAPYSILLSVLFVAVTVSSGSTAYPAEAVGASSAKISRVKPMPNSPQPFAMRDWQQVTRSYLDFVFDFDERGPHLPLVRWEDTSKTMIWMPAYVGNKDGPEAINYLAAVVSGSLVGLNMRTYHGHDWVAIATNFYNPADGVFPAGVLRRVDPGGAAGPGERERLPRLDRPLRDGRRRHRPRPIV